MATLTDSSSPWKRLFSSSARDRDTPKDNFFNPKLRQDAANNGDIYDPETLNNERQEWVLTGPKWEQFIENTNTKYLTHIKSLSKAWPHLRYLADFMEVGTTVARWPTLKNDMDPDGISRLERFTKTRVTRIDYYKSGDIWSNEYTAPDTLRDGIKGEHQAADKDDARQLMLFVVEDLSREVIEILGSHFDIDPNFFREHIVDYAWYNIRDRWINHPTLNVVTRRQRWLQLRFVRPRYFKTKDEFNEGFKQAEKFNVNRRPDDDQNINSLWDSNDAVVGLTRSRASFWMKSVNKNDGAKSEDHKKSEAVGIMLVDPTIEAGTPLWYGYRNWEPTPSVESTSPPPDPPRKSIYEDIIFWAKRPQGFRFSPSDKEPENVHLPIHALLHLVSAEWLIMCDYIKCRLGQIEWGISYPEHFMGKGDNIDKALKKLHVWRRLVPLYREMLEETMQRVFYFPCKGGATKELPTPGVATKEPAEPVKELPIPPENLGSVGALRGDFRQILTYLEEYQGRIDRLTTVVTAIISIEDSRRSQDDNRNMAQLTWLATFFIPLSYIASLFSMQDDLSAMGHTSWIYAIVAVPLAIISLVIARMLTYPRVHKFIKGLFTFGGVA